MKLINKLWGFRTNNTSKKFLAGLYYIFCLIIIVTLATEVPTVQSNIYDMIIFKISNILMALSFLLPVIFISNFKIKEKIPIIKKNRWWTDLIGCLLIFLIVIGSSECVNIFHSQKYLQRLDAANTTEIIYNEHNPDIVPEEDKSNLSKEQLNDNFDDLVEENNKNEDTSINNEPMKDNSSKNETNDNSNEEHNSTSKEESTPSEKPIYNNQILEIHFIDVGQGDSIFIELPNTQTMLIDAGESWKSTTVINYINDQGYTKLDYVIGTHPHADHIGGLAQVINNFSIGNIYMPKAVSTSKTYENLLSTIANKGLSVTTAKAGVNIINQNDLKIDIIAPNSSSYSNLNNYSAVIKITYGSKKFLFMGDAETKSESEILTDVSADVIKIGHHGSDTSSSQNFINRVKPIYAIVMVGSGNKYDHPYIDILNKWENSGAKIYRTDINGNIVVSSNGQNLNISTTK